MFFEFVIRLKQVSYAMRIKPNEVYEKVRVTYILRVVMRQAGPEIVIVAVL